jgi:selenocysteine lyase/cysteine desulfurase
MTPYHRIAEMIHSRGGLCFVDFACSAPYIDINMHPGNEAEKLDAIFFSPHKFLGGPGSTGVLVFDSALYHNRVPDNPGGGTVDWTNPWGEHKFVDSIEAREDGGTPPFLQTIKVALAIKLKEEMGVPNMMAREKELLSILWEKLCKINNLHILAANIKERLAIISFYIEGLHYNLAVRLLNDKFGIQVRGGCSCAGTYGHYLLNVTPDFSRKITEKISLGDLSDKPGWVRLSMHPIMTDEEAVYLATSIEELAANYEGWSRDYIYEPDTNEFHHKDEDSSVNDLVDGWL